MKIIKAGVLPERKLLRGTCTSCKAVVEVSASELQHPPQRDDGKPFVTCPTAGCGAAIYPKATRTGNDPSVRWNGANEGER